MDIFEIADSLPNGLHDAEVVDLALSYERALLQIRLDIWIDDIDAPEQTREEYRPARVELTQVEYCLFDRPDPGYPYKERGRLTIDLCAPDVAVDLPGQGTAFRLWVAEWNGFVHIRAGEAVLTWLGPATLRRTGG